MKNYLLIFFLCLVFNKTHSIETKIIHKIQNETITNVDIKNEFKYLLALNNSLKKIEKEKILSISNESAIREKIKEIEISKYYKKKKITIDALWNQLIIQKYESQITINEQQIKAKISKNNNIETKEYKLSEIIFEIKNKEDLQKKYGKIIKNIAEIGFENSASIFSISQSSKIGGDIGWISENSLNSKIKENIKYLKIGEVSKPIILSTGILILKIVDRRSSKIDINLQVEFKKAKNYERNRQLNQFSKIYYNKIKKNLNFNE
jgi:peptidyl-prolyl cis-trans isomerase SurA